MPPPLAPFHAPNSRGGHAKATGEYPIAFSGGADEADGIIIQDGLNISLSSIIRPVSDTVPQIFGLAAPTQVFNAVVFPAPILVSDDKSLRSTVAQECHRDHPMDIEVPNLPVDRHGNVKIPQLMSTRRWLEDASSPGAAKPRPICYSFDLAEAACGVIRRERDGFPDFHASVDSMRHGVFQ